MTDETKIPLPRSLQEIAGALLFASETPLTAGELRDAVRAVEPEEGENAEVMGVYKTCTGREIDAAIKGVGKALEVAGCGLKLVCTDGAYRLQTEPSCGRYVRAMLKMDRPSRLGRATLETLAIIAYRQPITKGEIEEIRGVDVSGNMKILLDLELVRLVGKSELPGHPFLYGTTPAFLEHFGLANLQQLNELDPTLQRSNPRLKAAAYRKPEKEEKEEKRDEVEKVGGEEAEEKRDEVEKVGGEEKKVEVEGEVEDVREGLVSVVTDDDLLGDEDDVVIDDTPDEFDDDDDDDEEDEEGEEGGEGEEDGDEGAGGAGAGGDADGL